MTTVQYSASSREVRPRAIGLIAGMAGLGMAAFLAVQLGGDAGTTTASSGGAGSQAEAATTSPGAGTPVDTVVGPPPQGMEMVGDEHGASGYVPAFGAGGRPELLPLGSGEGVAGMEVVDDRGELVGYMVDLIGFVELHEAADPDVIDGLVARQAALGSGG